MDIAHFDPSDSDSNSTTTAAVIGGDTYANSERRKICGGCDRPASICLCDILPTEQISTTRTQILILHHPHEQRHRLATVPLLAKCLKNCEILVGRRLRRNVSPVLDSLSGSPNHSVNAAFLFPGTEPMPSVEISEWKASIRDSDVQNYLLIVFDGTWKHAKEMVNASFPFLSEFASQVCLRYDLGVDGGDIFNSSLILRKEPFSGCMSTMEAVARCLRVLEPNGVEIESKLIEVLRAMVRFQASFLKPMKPRPKLLKKGKVVVEEEGKKNSI